jgi:hypothetical protein
MQEILTRLRRKIDIIRLDQKQAGKNLGGHASEALKLIDILEKKIERQGSSDSSVEDRGSET